MCQNQPQSDKFAFDRSENVDKSDSVGGNLFDAAPLNYTLCGARAIFRRLKVLTEITEKKKSFLNAGVLQGAFENPNRFQSEEKTNVATQMERK